MKILVSDFDGTLYDENFNNNIETVNEFVNNGNIFIIATGRNVTSLKNELEECNLKYSYLICNDGGVIYDNTETLIYKKAINQELVKKIYDILDKNRKAVGEIFIDVGGEYSIDTNDECISLIAKIKDNDKCETLLRNIIEEFPEVTGYLSTRWINIINKNNSKSEAIKYLIDNFNYNSNDIYTIGDNINDLEMIRDYNGYYINHCDKLANSSLNEVSSIEELINNIK